MLRYMAHLGYEKSSYRVGSRGDYHPPVDKLSIATADIPEERALYNDTFVQTTLVFGTGAHNVLLRAAKEWETTSEL